MRTDNKTLLGISSDAERCVWIIWSIAVFLASMIGDSLILIATLKYRAIRHRKVIVAVMQHMAVCDMIQAVFRVFPSILSLSMDRWVLGEILCHAEETITFLCGAVTMYLTCAITTFKLITVKFPLKTGAWSSRLGHRVCACLWLFELCIHSPIMVGKSLYLADTIHFSYRVYNCGYNKNSPKAPGWFRWYNTVGVTSMSLISYTILIVATVLLLGVAKRAAARHGDRMKWEGVITVLLTVAVLLVSYLPSVLAGQLIRRLKLRPGPTTFRAIVFLQYLNITANFFVYALTVKSFNKFLRRRLSQASLTGSGPSNGRRFTEQGTSLQLEPSQQQQQRLSQSQRISLARVHVPSLAKISGLQKKMYSRNGLIIENTNF